MSIAQNTISVAIACYNGARFLQEQIESIWNQSLPPAEIVAFDDASTDGTLALLQTLAAKSPVPMRVMASTPNRGSTQAFAKAIAACSGEWIALADQDDVWLPHKLATLHRTAEELDWDAVFSDAMLVDQFLQPTGKNLLANSRVSFRVRRRLRQGKTFQALMRFNVVTGATLMFRTRCVPKVLPIAEAWLHDYWLALIIASQGRLGLVDEVLMLYRQHGGNQIGAKAGIRHEIQAAAEKPKDRYLEEAALFARLEQHLAAEGLLMPEVAKALKGKQDFLEQRYQLRALPRRRLALVARGLGQHSYFLYGQGWRTLLKDLLVP